MNRSEINELFKFTKRRIAREAKNAKVEKERDKFLSNNLKQRITTVFDHEIALEARDLLRDTKSKFSVLVIKLASEIFGLRTWDRRNYKVIPILEIPSLKNFEEDRKYFISLLIPTKGPLDNILILDEVKVQSGYIGSMAGKITWMENVIASELLLKEAKRVGEGYDLIQELFWTNRLKL
jgi:hypothetical protein